MNGCESKRNFYVDHRSCFVKTVSFKTMTAEFTGWANKNWSFFALITFQQFVVEKRVICQKFAGFFKKGCEKSACLRVQFFV